MKSNYIKLTAVVVLTAIFILPPSARSQDTKKPEKSGKMKIRIEKDENGKKTVIDTVVNISDPEAMKGVEELMEKNNIRMKKIDEEMRLVDDQMKDVDDQMRRVEIIMQNLDSTMNDSAMNFTKRIIINGDEPGNFRYRVHPDAYSFDFDMPEIPEIPEFEYFDFDAPEMPPIPHVKRMRGGNGQSLSDVLGDIPMSHVKSYSIKETRNGKKITIEVDDDAVIGGQDRVIIIRPDRPGRPAHPPRHPREPREPQMEKEIQIEKN